LEMQMNTRGTLNFRVGLVVLFIGVLATSLIAETLYVDGISGDDSSVGTQDKPLKTISKASAMVNNSSAAGPTTIKIGPGVYNLAKVVVFKNERAYTEKDRLTIEAAVLPDDANWKPAFMPVILSSESSAYNGQEKHTFSLNIEISHATVRGLKFLGNPGPRAWHYAVFRGGMNLEDLVITQCLFVGDKFAIPYNCCIAANGQRTVLDHNIFYHCEIPVVI